MIQDYCSCCKSRFFVDEEHREELIRHGFLVCDDCQDFIYFCPLCKRIVLNNIYVESKINSCPDCCNKYKINKNSFYSVWIGLRFLTFKRDGFICRYCGRSPLKDKDVVLQCDHITPRAKGGDDTLENLVTSCSECNGGKVDVMFQNELKRKIIKRRVEHGLKTITNKTKAIGCVKVEDIKKNRRTLEHSKTLGKGNV